MNTKKPKPRKIPVVVRRWHGEIIFLFPTIPSDYSGYNVESYMFVGQHGGADPDAIVRNSQPVPREEAEELIKRYQSETSSHNDTMTEYVLRQKCTYRHFLTRMEDVKRTIARTADPLEPHDRMVGN